MPAHVMILGCGRSGTSILGELFLHLSAYSYHSEPGFADMASWDFSVPQAVKVPREHPDFPAQAGLSFPLEALETHFPAPHKLYWQVRHPLDTICSLRVGISRNWGHHPRPHDWQAWLDRPLLEQCAHHWAYLNRFGYEQVHGIAQLKHFEDMIADPLAFAQEICVEIGLDPQVHADELQSWATRVQDTNNAQFVEAETSRAYSTADHQVRVGRWRENLSEAEAQQIWPILAETATKMGYAYDDHS